MKKNSRQKVTCALLVTFVGLFPFAGYAATGNTSQIFDEMQKFLDQYKTRITQLEAENNLLRRIVAEKGIQIPLDAYNSALSGSGAQTGTILPVVPPVSTSTLSSAEITNRFSLLTPLERGFIEQIHKDWEGIKGAYQLPTNSVISGYEFVQDEQGTHAFADIVSDGGTEAGAYTTKILYEFDPTTFARKLIGLFTFDEAKSAYVTRIGKNPFAKVPRKFIASPYGWVSPKKGAISPDVPTGVDSAQPNTPTPTPANDTIISSLNSAYQNGKYNEVIQLSDAFLKNNAPTYDVLRYRYRTFFITKQYSNALAEIDKMESLKFINESVYCDAYVVALYGGKNDQAQQYKKKAGASCKAK